MSLFKTAFIAPTLLAATVALSAGCGQHDTRSASSSSSKSEMHAESASPYDRPGYVTHVVDGRLWVFAEGSDEAMAMAKEGKHPAKHVTRIAVGPAGMTVRSPSIETLNGYLVAKDGFSILEEEGRYWIYPEGEAPADGKHPAKHVTKVKAGPGGVTLRGPDTDTILAYIATKPGFHVEIEDGRIWVFKAGTEGHAKFLESGKLPAKHVTKIKVGPRGTTVRGPDVETINEYIAAADGFVTGLDDGRIWVFEKGSKEAAAFLADGKHPAKHITRVAAGPMGKTVRSPDLKVLNAYLRATR